MNNDSMQGQGQRTWLLRCWRESVDGEGAWHFSLQASDQPRYRFRNLTKLVTFMCADLQRLPTELDFRVPRLSEEGFGRNRPPTYHL